MMLLGHAVEQIVMFCYKDDVTGSGCRINCNVLLTYKDDVTGTCCRINELSLHSVCGTGDFIIINV